MAFQKGSRVVGVREGRFDQLVVGLVKRILRPRHEGDCWKAHAQGQKKECDDFDKLGRGVMGTRGVVAERFSLGSSQPKPRAGRRKHIADGPQGAASMGASKAKVAPRVCALPRESHLGRAHRPRMTQTSAAKRRSCLMQWRRCRANGSAAARRPYPQ